MAVSDEVMVNFGANVTGNFFDQNRVIIGIGHKIREHTRMDDSFLVFVGDEWQTVDSCSWHRGFPYC